MLQSDSVPENSVVRMLRICLRSPGNVVDGCVPKNLPIQIKICMDDSVSHRNDLSLRNESSEVVATIASILLHAARISFRKDSSCRIDDAGVFEDCGAYPRLQPAFGDQVYGAPCERLQFLGEGIRI